MRKPMLLAAAAAAALAAAVAYAADTPEDETITGRLVGVGGAQIGEVRVREAGNGLLIHIEARDLPPGSHGMHLHQTADCSDVDGFETAGDHISSEGEEHGFLAGAGPHDGDLPNLIVGDDGAVAVELQTSRLPLRAAHGPLLDRDGAALVIHAGEDDYLDPDGGGSGARIACAAFETEPAAAAPAE